MKIFVCEFITCGGFINQALPDSLAKEGDMMLRAVVNDLLQIKNLHISITRDYRLETISNIEQVIIIEQRQNCFDIWEQCFRESEVCLIIAPETDNVLYDLHQLAEKNDCLILGCDLDAIKLCSSKIQCIQKLTQFGVSTPETYELENKHNLFYPFVVKPDDGVGGEHCFFIEAEDQLNEILKTSPEVKKWIAQQYISGAHASVSILIYNKQFKILAINEQTIALNNNQFILRSIVVNKYAELHNRLETEINQIIAAIPGLSGVIGIDFILSDDDIYFLEINPRLTTAYTGLVESININTMKYLVDSYNNNQLQNIDVAITGTSTVTI